VVYIQLQAPSITQVKILATTFMRIAMLRQFVAKNINAFIFACRQWQHTIYGMVINSMVTAHSGSEDCSFTGAENLKS